MAGPKLRWMQVGAEGSVRDTNVSGAPSHVSLAAKSGISMVGQASGNSLESRLVLSDRPSTSGGLPTRKPNSRRESRDDLHIFPSRANQLGTTYYNFPLPASSPAHSATPISSPPRTYSSESEKSEVSRLNYTCAEVGIGMAIGSPTQIPASWSPQVQYRSPRNENLETQDDCGLPSRTKSSRWRLLGGIFSRKPNGQEASTEVQAFNQNNYLDFPAPPPEKRGRRTTLEKRSRQHKPEIRRAATMPDVNIQRPKEFPMMKDKQLPIGPLLDVDIPNVEMERYSVMFGNVIKPSSLLARRQGNLERLKTVDEAMIEPENRPRRGTSPLPAKSPAMSLFPTISRTQRDLPLPLPQRTLHRSNTSPAALSPSRQTFLNPKPVDPSARLSSPWCPDVPLDSPASNTSVEIEVNTPLKPAPEPKWEMVTKHTKHTAPPQIQFNSINQNQSHPIPRKQSLQSSLDALAQAEDDEAEELINTAANISIARQISVSRRQKQMLVPIKARMNGRLTPRSVEETPAVFVQAVGHVSERKQMIPMVVNVATKRAERGERAVLVRV